VPSLLSLLKRDLAVKPNHFSLTAFSHHLLRDICLLAHFDFLP
jgi:hypothetical protein